MTERIIDNELRLIPYYRNDEASLPWYQDLDVCRQVDNREKPYDVELLHRMYDYLTAHGDCYYIEYKGVRKGCHSACAGKLGCGDQAERPADQGQIFAPHLGQPHSGGD